MRFADRAEAGRQLAEALRGEVDPAAAVIFAIPRGGVVVGAEVARALGAPLLPLVVRKVGAPFNPELAIGAVAPGALLLHRALCRELGLSEEAVREAVARAREELAARLERLGAPDRLPDLEGRDAVLVDDGIATGATAELALRVLATRGPRRRVLAVPVAPREVLARLQRHADRCVCLHTPEPFLAVSAHYRRFGQVDDQEVRALLESLAPGGEDHKGPPPRAH